MPPPVTGRVRPFLRVSQRGAEFPFVVPHVKMGVAQQMQETANLTRRMDYFHG